MKKALFALGLSLALLIGCTRPESSNGSGPVVDMEMMAFLSEARALHHQANLKEENGDLPGAAGAIERLTTARRPSGASPEVQEVMADAYARLGEIRLKQRLLPSASDAIKSGLTFANEPSYFRGHLLEVEGLIEEARSNEFKDAGQLEEAVHAREKAIQLLEEVVKIQDQVIARSLAAKDGGGR